MRHIAAFLLACTLLSPVLAQTARDEADAVLTSFHQAASRGDFDAYFGLFASDAVFIGTDDWERWTRPEFEDYARPIFARGTGWTYTMHERHIRIADDGRTAWFDELLHNASMGLTRGSGTLIREEGAWKVALYNLSIPVPNELAGDLVARIRAFDAQDADPASAVEALVDSLAAAAIDAGQVAGMAVGVVQAGDTLVLRQYGFADLEYRIPTPPHAVFEIGSITKQFTAAAVLRLAEQGKVDLDADVTTYLPDFDTRGRSIPLWRMLDHTSGLQGYTEMEVFGNLTVQALPRDTLVSLIESWPFWHEPGEQLIYSNSAYFMLGLLIEHVAGTTYEAFLEREFFEPLGMQDTRYCSNTAIVPNRMHGYDYTPTGLQRTAYLDHRWPYAAGSLCSSVEDLLAWNAALHGGRVLSDAAYRAMTTPRPLADGSMVRYAAGVGVLERAGGRIIEHGGDINGFRSAGVHLTDEQTTVVVLFNTDGPVPPAAVVNTIVEHLVPEPRAENRQPEPAIADAVVGAWSGPDRRGGSIYHVSREGNAFALSVRDRPARRLRYDAGGWFTVDQGPGRVGLFTGTDGRPRLHVDTVGGYSILVRVE